MHVAYVLDSFPVVSQTFVSDEIHSVRAAGIRCSVFPLKLGPLKVVHPRAREILDAGVVRVLGPASAWSDFANVARFALRNPLRTARTLLLAARDKRFRWCARRALPIANEIVSCKCTHVHAHFADTAARVAMWVHRWTGVPFTFTTHGYDIFDTPPPDIEEMTADSAAMVCISRYNIAYLERNFGLPPGKMRLIRCGIYVDEFAGDYRAPDADPVEVRILCVARLSAEKGHEYLLHAVHILVQRGLKPTLRCAGGGELLAALGAQIRALEMERHVEFLGAVSTAEVRQLLEWCDIAVLPSLRESLGLANAEAMAAGRPVVATAVLGVPELVQDRVTGLVCPPGDSKALAEAIEWIMRNPGEAAGLVARGRERVASEFNRIECTRQLLELWSPQSKLAGVSAKRCADGT